MGKDPFAIARAFMRSRIILSAAELDVFSLIDRGDATAEKMAERTGADRRALTRLLDCLVTFGMLDKTSGVYRLTEEGAPLSSEHPASSLPMVLHINTLWDSWAPLTRIVMEGSQQELALPRPTGSEGLKAFIGAMHVVGRKLSQEIASSLELGGFHKMIDVGGGSGTYTIAFLKRNPQLKGVLFDLEGVIPMARERLTDEGLLDRVKLVAGDFYADELPPGCDLALLSAIIHQNSPQQNLELYKKIYRALEPGGTILIRDHIMDDARIRPPEGAMFAINMLVNTRGGDTYTFREVSGGLEAAGFEQIRQLRSGEHMDSVIAATKRKS